MHRRSVTRYTDATLLKICKNRVVRKNQPKIGADVFLRSIGITLFGKILPLSEHPIDADPPSMHRPAAAHTPVLDKTLRVDARPSHDHDKNGARTYIDRSSSACRGILKRPARFLKSVWDTLPTRARGRRVFWNRFEKNIFSYRSRNVFSLSLVTRRRR